MNGLKQTLIEYLQRNKRLDLNQLYSLCGQEMKKTSNAERRLRELMSPLHKDFDPHIKAEKNDNRAIIAYYWQKVAAPVPAYKPPQTEAARIFLNQWKPEVKKETANRLW